MPDAAAALGDLFEGAAGLHGGDVFGQRVFIGHRVVALLDQQPVVMLLAARALLVVTQPDQRPATLHALAIENDFEMAFRKVRHRIHGGLRFPGAAIPKLHRAAAIFALRNGAFEGAIFQRMIFHLDRQALHRRIERRRLGHGPGLVDAVQLQPQVVMQPCRIVALDDEAARLRFRRRAALRLSGHVEIAFRAIDRKPRHLCSAICARAGRG